MREKEKKNNERVAFYVSEWRMLEQSGRIKKLIVRYYDSLPSHYCCIFGHRAMLVGLYTYRDWSNPKDTSNHDFGEPFVAISNTAAQVSLIEKYINWFDRVFQMSCPDSDAFDGEEKPEIARQETSDLRDSQ